MAAIRNREPVCRYDLTFRYTVKNFPKEMTYRQYEDWLKRKLKIKNLKEGYKERGRRTVFLNWLTEREKRRICRIADTIDDGILREVIVDKRYTDEWR